MSPESGDSPPSSRGRADDAWLLPEQTLLKGSLAFAAQALHLPAPCSRLLWGIGGSRKRRPRSIHAVPSVKDVPKMFEQMNVFKAHDGTLINENSDGSHDFLSAPQQQLFLRRGRGSRSEEGEGAAPASHLPQGHGAPHL